MDAKWREEPQVGFGTDSLCPYAPRRIEVVGGKSKRALRDHMLQSCPQVPGVYGMLNRKGELTYVGKSKSLRSRLLSYFADSNARQKGGRIIESTRAIQWETQPSEFASLVREQSLIRRFSPRWNVQGVPKRQRPVYLCLGRKPATFFLSALPPRECQAIEGPFFGVGRMKTAVDSLNRCSCLILNTAPVACVLKSALAWGHARPLARTNNMTRRSIPQKASWMGSTMNP